MKLLSLFILLILASACNSSLTFDAISISPKLSLTSVHQDNYIKTSDLTTYAIKGVCKNTDILSITIDGVTSSSVCNNNVFNQTYDFSARSDGPIQVQIIGKRKEKETILEYTLIKDTVIPTGSISISGLGSTLTNDNSPRNLSLSSLDDYFTVKIALINSGSCAGANFVSRPELPISLVIPLQLNTNNTNQICIIGADRSGNWQLTPISSSVVTIDTLPPTLQFSTTNLQVASSSSNQIDWSLTELNPDSSANMTLEYSSTGNAPWTIINQRTVGSTSLNNQAYNQTWSVPSSSVANGKIRLTLTDLAGNSAVSEVPLIIDNSSPVLNSIVLAEGASTVGVSTIGVQANATPSLSSISHIRVSEDSGFSGATWVAYNNGQTTIALSQTSGTKTVYVQVRSSSGQTSNILSSSVILDFGSPPQVVVTSPLSGTNYSPGAVVSIAWSCTTSSGAGLATNPITYIRYSVDDGESYHVIATDQMNNLSATSGNYSWTVPMVTPTGQTVSSTKPMRISVNCSSSAGVVSSGMSELLNSSWKVLAGEPGNIDENVHMSAANLSSNSGIFIDSTRAYYYSRKHAIMRIHPVTGLVSVWAGSLSKSGCTLGGGVTGLTETPEIIDITNLDEIIIFSKACNELYKFKLSDKSLVWSRPLTATYSTPEFYRQYLKSGILYYHSNYAIYRLDLNSLGSTPTVVIGTPGSCGTPVVVDTAITSSPIDCSSGQAYQPIVSRDEKKIWITASGVSVIKLELDETSGLYYRRATSITALNRCVQVNFDNNKLFCLPTTPTSTSNALTFLDTLTETISANHSIGVFNGFSAQMYLSSSHQGVLAKTTNNEVFEIKYDGVTWSEEKLIGSVFHNYGNGTNSSRVAFTAVSGIKYDSVSQNLYVRGVQHLRRMHVNTSNPSDIHVDLIQTGMSTTFGNTVALSGFAMKADGSQIAGSTTSSNSFFLRAVDTSTWDSMAQTVSQGTAPSYHYRNTTGITTYPTIGQNFASTHVGSYNLRPTSRSVLTYLSNGRLYFYGTSDALEQSDMWIYESTGSAIKFIAGATGSVGFDSGSHGTVASGARFTAIYGMQDDTNGDLRIFDGHHMRKVTVTTESGSPKIYNEIDFSTFANFPGYLKWNHAIYDNSTGWSYFAIVADVANGIPAQVWGARAAEGFVEISVNGLSLLPDDSIGPTRSLNLEISPLGLLLLDSAKKRILQTDLFN